MAATVETGAFMIGADEVLDAKSLRELIAEHGESDDSGDETTPTTTVSELSEVAREDEWESEADDVPQLAPGLFDSDVPSEAPPIAALDAQPSDSSAAAPQVGGAGFTPEETLFIFDWDDTILPSSWIQRQGLRLDSSCVVRDWQRELLAEVAATTAITLTAAKRQGTVVFVTNGERGWIELSCQKFMPSLLPVIENVKLVSARTLYESPRCTSPLEWKVRAFAAEIARACGAEAVEDPTKRKNIHSLGDSVHEREALLRATAKLPNCRSKSLKFVDRPDIAQILKQHALIMRCFDEIVQHDENVDSCIDCS
eukprot:CAMPEP_0176043282 /NCGR_PEP_ID=MMETSP0120_2-20121206/21478_1 /TAXON_ID=160619 /ORGANISM="Kryptoperidinium foliaceum, Strain CCMP 1326" /LENGTH=311 /DNA_ID=CAMNT_0017376689 /DNA_START=119 /DNA_END=1054 /DNA_ORIENTATION=-